MTSEQTQNAIAQALSFCRGREAAYKEGCGEYISVSLREVLYELGFTDREASEVIQACADRGFNYCVDPMIANPRSNEFPRHFACVWGIDQLRSRLEFVL